MISRRAFVVIVVGGVVTAPSIAMGKTFRVGFLGNSTAMLEANLVGPFREGLRELGYVEGQNVAIDYRWA